MTTHSSTLAWKIPWTEEPGRLQFMGSIEKINKQIKNATEFSLCYWKISKKDACECRDHVGLERITYQLGYMWLTPSDTQKHPRIEKA